MKRPTLSRSSKSKQTDTNEQIEEVMREAISDLDDKVIEIRPASESRGNKTFPLLVLVGGVVALGYWLRRTQRPTEMLQNAANEAADRTKQATGEAGETIQEGGETVAETVEEESQKAGKQVKQTGEDAAEAAEEAGEKVDDLEDESDHGSFDTSSRN